MPFRTAIRVLTIMPCISELAARSIVAEIGTDMTRFPTASGFISWAVSSPQRRKRRQAPIQPPEQRRSPGSKPPSFSAPVRG